MPCHSGEYFLDVWGVFGLWLTYKWTILVGRTFHASGFFTQTLHWQSLMSFSGRREKDTCKSWKAAERGDILVEARQKLNGHSIQVGSKVGPRWDPSDPLTFCQTVFNSWRWVLHQSRELTKSWNCQWAVNIFWGPQDIKSISRLIGTMSQFGLWTSYECTTHSIAPLSNYYFSVGMVFG